VNGQLVYTPDANFNGTDTFTYSADDGMGGTAQATVTVTVTSVNDAPVAVGDTAVTNEDSPVTLEPLANDSDPEGGVLAITALDGTPVVAGGSVTLASGAVVTLNADATVTFDPNGAFDALAAGGDPAIVRVPYSFVDAGGLTATGTIEITVTGVNDPAVFSGRMSATLSEDDAGTSGQITVTDPDSPAQMAAGSYSGTYGNLVIAADGRWNYSRTAVLDYLEPGQSVTDRFAVVAADGSSATLDITIEGVLDHETIVGTAAGETLTGGTGNDTITGQGGDDTISGGDGFDYAAYLGTHDAFDFAFAADGSGFTVTDTITRDGLDEGTDLLLAGTDAIVFADGVTGELNWNSGQPVSMVLRHNGQIIQKLSETSGGVEKVVAYHEGGATTVTYTDTGMDGGSKPWASRTQTLNSNRKVTQSDIVYDDGTSRSVQNTYENGVLASQTLTDGAGSASSARWASILRSLDGAGKIVRADFVFDDGTTRTAETSYVDGVRTGRIETDGSGVHSSAHWSRLERYFDTSGQLVRQVKLRDDGDRTTSLFEQGVLTTRIREDLNGDQRFESKTTTFASDGTVVDTSYVWDVIA
jgi:VCBS repeat-containing protein